MGFAVANSWHLPPEMHSDPTYQKCTLTPLICLLRPDETETKLIVDPDAVLPRAITMQRFETIAWWRSKVPQLRSIVELHKLARRNTENPRESSGLLQRWLCDRERSSVPHAASGSTCLDGAIGWL